MRCASLIFLLCPLATQAAEPIDFNRDVRPILSENCYACHGPDPDQRKADIRIDTREGATEFDTIVPGKPDDSELIARIISDSERKLMPPPKSGKKRLSEKQIQTLKDWIQQGAPYAKHWAYVAPQKATPPRTDMSPIDAFVYAKLLEKGLDFSPEANRTTLARRVALDLTGLPPTWHEVQAFVKDPAENAYERYVDLQLAKPAFGEHWARTWLDLARYADSAGYADDPSRTIWGYRDYVIRSFNDNKPFDQFTIEQIAGDMLPNPTPEQLIATAFHRNTMTNNEGGTNDEEFRNAAVIDRVNTTLAVWMGTSMACAQCHTHKYDPITQTEYFQVFAIFNNSADADRKDESPTFTNFTEAQQKQQTELKAQIASLQQQITQEATPQTSLKTEISKRKGSLPIQYLRVQAIGKQILHVAEIEAFVDQVNVAATKGKATQSSTDYDAPAARAIDGVQDGDFFKSNSVTHTKLEDNPWIEIDLGEELSLEKVLLWNRTDGTTASRLKHFYFVGMDKNRKPVWVQEINDTPNPAKGVDVPARFEDFSDVDRTSLAAYLKSLQVITANQKKLEQLQQQLANIKGVTTPIMQELAADKGRTSKLQIRGNYLQTGDIVTPGLPKAMHPLPKDVKVDRMGLALWLVADDNPLTARVLANRFWENLFGKGIVLSSEEFGSQGELPTHPKLLDWLAVELQRDLKWNMKAMLKEMVMSRTYRQTSKVTDELLVKDHDNEWYARGPRFRISAEMIRDQALAVTGLLSDKMYGPSVNPPQPDLNLRAAFGGSLDWKTSEAGDAHRRGLYTEWRRTNPYPSMITFDAPSREACMIRRVRTNTPLQALVTLNDPCYIEAAQALARKMIVVEGDIATKAAAGLRICLQREAAPEEAKRLAQLFEELRLDYAANPAEAQKMATDPIGPAPTGVDVVDLAAWTVVGNVLLNLDEMFLKR